jgi:hypothetical protein
MRRNDLSFAIIISGFVFTAPWDWNLLAGSDCIVKPSSSSSGHWYYHTDPATRRKCWYVASSTQIRRSAPPQQVSLASSRDVSVRAVDATSPQYRAHSSRTPASNGQENLFLKFLRWQDQHRESDTLPPETSKDALFREFLIWQALHTDP